MGLDMGPLVYYALSQEPGREGCKDSKVPLRVVQWYQSVLGPAKGWEDTTEAGADTPACTLFSGDQETKQTNKTGSGAGLGFRLILKSLISLHTSVVLEGIKLKSV